jgi:uncharacterized membrane protein YvbJ
MQLTGIQCSNCGGNELLQGQQGQLLCAYCGSAFGEVTRICPHCGHYNEADVRHCGQCGEPIIRTCPACGRDNWILAEHCVQCGRNLDVIERIARRWQETTQQPLEDHRAGVAAVKDREERASQERLAEFLEIERRRQEALAQARQVQRKQEQQIWWWVGAALFVALVVVILALLLSGGGG